MLCNFSTPLTLSGPPRQKKRGAGALLAPCQGSVETTLAKASFPPHTRTHTIQEGSTNTCHNPTPAEHVVWSVPCGTPPLDHLLHGELVEWLLCIVEQQGLLALNNIAKWRWEQI